MFQVKVNGEVVKELDVDSRLVGSVTIGVDTLPVQFSQSEVNLVINLKSATDAEYLDSLAREEFNAAQEKLEADQQKALAALEKKPAKKAVAKKAPAKKAR